MAWERPSQLRKKSIPMRVLNLGMSRTGTTSMCAALEILGCTACYHLDYDSDDCAFWVAAMEAKYDGKGKPFGREEWDHIFATYDAVSDLPTVLFGPELAAAYPEAKILLTVRDPDEWHQSMLATVCNPVYRGWYHRFPALFFPKEQALCEMSDKCEDIAWHGDCAKFGKEFYLMHNRQVRQISTEEGVSSDTKLGEKRFLEWQLGEGWDRLAPFLGSAVPSERYPKGNNVAEFLAEADLHAQEMWLAVGRKLFVWSLWVVGGIGSAWWFGNRFMPELRRH